MPQAELLETKLPDNSALDLCQPLAELNPDWFDPPGNLCMFYLRLAQYKDRKRHMQTAVKLAATPNDQAVALSNMAWLFKGTN